MTSPGLLILALVVAIAVILFCIIVLKLNAAIGMVIACLVMGSYGWTRFASLQHRRLRLDLEI